MAQVKFCRVLTATLIAILFSSWNISAQNKVNGHEYVDLGLSVKWATCNVGASSPHDYGNRYDWGEIDNWNMKHNDVAKTKWGGGWRTPTNKEMQELCDNCTWEFTKKNGINGYLISGSNGNSIFLPASGMHSTLCDIGEEGSYWTSTEHKTAYWGGLLWFNNEKAVVAWDLMGRLHCIRPVIK